MKCLVPGQNVKIIARSINSLAKIGDEIFMECSEDGIVLRTVNTAQSAFAEFRMFRSFFSAFNFGDDEADECVAKLTMKSFLGAFKNPHCMDKHVESCEIKMRPTGNVVVFQVKYANSYVRKYYLPTLENERLEANVPDSAPNGFTVSSKFLASAIKNFRHSEDEVTFSVEKEKTFIKNHLELKRDENFMRTELCFHPTEFENYSVTSPTSITFCFKELRAVLAFAEPSGLPVKAMFSSPGRPILFKVENHPAHEASYVVSTLNSTNANVDSSLVGSQRTSLGSQRNSLKTLRGSGPYDFNCETPPDIRIDQQSSMDATPQNHSRSSQSRSNRAGQMMPPELGFDVEMQEVANSEEVPLPQRIEETVQGSSIHSSYGSSSEIFNNASPVTLSPYESRPSSSAIDKDETDQRLARLVFTRCYKPDYNLLDDNEEHKVVLANDSDPEQV